MSSPALHESLYHTKTNTNNATAHTNTNTNTNIDYYYYTITTTVLLTCNGRHLFRNVPITVMPSPALHESISNTKNNTNNNNYYYYYYYTTTTTVLITCSGRHLFRNVPTTVMSSPALHESIKSSCNNTVIERGMLPTISRCT